MFGDSFCIASAKAMPSVYNDRQFYFLPHPLLRKYVSHYTFSYSVAKFKKPINDSPKELILIPAGSGCLILGCNEKGWFESCWGPTAKPVKVQKDDMTKDERMFFIEFLPGGLYAFTGVPQQELRDIQCSIYDIQRKLMEILRVAVETSQSIEELIYKTDHALLSAMNSRNILHGSVISVMDKIKQAGGELSVKGLADNEYISERHLSRLFEKNIGISVKMYERLTRINKAVKLFKSSSIQSVACIAQETGFFDESHLIHDFNEFCSTTPSTLVQNMSDFYNEPFKY